VVHIDTQLKISKAAKRSWLFAAIFSLVQPGILASAIDAQPAHAPTQTASFPSGPLSPSSTMDAGYSDMYNLDFDGAHKTFQVWERSHPGDPLGPTSEAAADLFWQFNQMHVLESDLFLDDDQFFYRQAPGPDQQVRARFEREIARAENLADKRLAAAPDDTNALFAEVLDAGMEGDYAAMVENRYLASLAYVKRSGRLAEKLLALDPSCYDAYLAIGVENYILSLSPMPVRWLLDLYGAQTDQKTGIEKLKLTAASGHYLEPYARVLLAVAALRGHDRDRAKQLLQGLVRQFPHNQLYARELARLQ
jgi:hypothetical protein